MSTLTPEEEAFKQSWLPKAPNDLSNDARLLFEAAVNKIKCTPSGSGGLIFEYDALTEEELFAIGRSLFDPSSVRRKLQDLWPRRQICLPDREERFNVIVQPHDKSNPDLVAAESRVRETIRKEILVGSRSQQFPIGRREGALAPIHRFLHTLFQLVCPKTFEDFWKAIEAAADNHAADDSITLHETEGTTLRYVDRGKDKEIEKNTIRNKFKSYKKISP